MKTDKQRIDAHSCVFPRRFDKDLPRAVKASGVWIEDDAGERYLDAGGGALLDELRTLVASVRRKPDKHDDSTGSPQDGIDKAA